MKDQEKIRIQNAINHINTSDDVDPWACEIAVAAMEALLVGGGCSGCAFESMEEWEMPCRACKRNCKDYWRKADSSETNTGKTKFQPGDKFLLEIGEKRIAIDEYEIVGTDLYVWSSLLEELPKYEPEQKTGWWIYDGEYKNGMVKMKCSICGKVIETFEYTSQIRYCQNCGAKMEDKNEPERF